MSKIKNILTSGTFLATILGLAAACWLSPAAASSEAERRPLAQAPSVTADAVISGKFFTQFDDYVTDQFPARDFFRSVKAHFQLYALNISENNGLTVQDGYIAKVNTELNAASVANAAGKLAQVYNRYLAGADTRNFLAIVPDKGYFLGRDYGYPALDYAALADDMRAALPDFAYVDLFDSLSLSDYYRTDTHWSQDKLLPVAAQLAGALGVPLAADYQTLEHYPFNGVYAGQSALNPQPDTLYYLTNDTLAACTVYDYETGETRPVYDVAKLDTAEPYDVFLSGTRALLRIDNPAAGTDRQLILFRDSYGAALAPLLAEAYSSIVLVDLRYINPQILGNYIEFGGQDVLFLYSTLLLNDSFALK